MAEEVPEFADAVEEAAYWKLQFETKELEYLDLEETFEEFQQTSKAVEEEMEKELESTESKLKDAERQLEKFRMEYKKEKDKTRNLRRQSTQQLTTMEDDLGSLLTKEKKLRFKCQKLEQENDDLEQRHRQLQATIDYLQERLDRTLEENVLQQTEMEDLRCSSEEVIQRLRDDLRDQKSELMVRTEQLSTLKRTLLMEAPSTPKNHRRKRSRTTLSSSTGTGASSPAPRPHTKTISGSDSPASGQSKRRSAFLDETGYEIPLHMIDDMLMVVSKLERNILSRQCSGTKAAQ